MAIDYQPNQRIIAFRIDDGPWWFDEEFLKIWVTAGEATEVHDFRSANPPDGNTKKPSQRLLKILGIGRNGHSHNGNMLGKDE